MWIKYHEKYIQMDEKIMSENYQIDETLDCKGQYCPMPIVKMKKALKSMTEGQILKILATDPGSKRDFESFSKKTGNKLLESSEKDGVFTYIIKKVEA
jgi:tRNA 2-thiouridine synthesizing protein A